MGHSRELERQVTQFNNGKHNHHRPKRDRLFPLDMICPHSQSYKQCEKSTINYQQNNQESKVIEAKLINELPNTMH